MSYPDRLKQAFNFRTNPVEALARTAGATLLASLALNGVEDSGVDTGIPPIYSVDPKPAHVEKRVVKGEERYVPARLAKITETGPSVSLSFPQAYAPEFRAASFNTRQEQRLDRVIGELRDVFRDHPDAKVRVSILGLSSDESDIDSKNGDQNLGRPSRHDRRLAQQRAELVEAYIKDKPEIDDDISFTTRGKEIVLDSEAIGEIDRIAGRLDMSRAELIEAHNKGNKLDLSESEKATIQDAFDANRGAEISSTVTYKTKQNVAPCDQVVRLVKDPDTEQAKRVPPEDGWDLHVIPIILPPGIGLWRRLRRRLPKPGGNSRAPLDPESTTPQPRQATTDTPRRQRPKRQPRISTAERRRARLRSIDSELRTDKSMLDIYKPSKTFETSHLSDFTAERRKHHQENIRRLRREKLGIKARQYVSRAAVTAILLPFIPFPWEETHDRKNSVQRQRCATTETDYGKRTRGYLNLSGIAVVRAIEGRDDWNKQLDWGESVAPDRTTYSHQAYNRFIVDKTGRVIQKEHIPAYSYEP